MKMSRWGAALAAVLFLAGCQSPLTSAGSSGSVAPGPIVGGRAINISFPGAGSTGRQITIGTAKGYANFFQVIAYNATNHYVLNLGTSLAASGSIPNVAAGTYTVIALAGLNLGGATPVIVELAGASQSGVTVTASQSGSAALVLQNVLYSQTANPANPTINSTFTLTTTFDTNIPTVGPLVSGTSSWYTAVSQGSWTAASATLTNNAALITGTGATGSGWTTSSTFNTPSTAQTLLYAIGGGPQAELGIVDPAISSGAWQNLSTWAGTGAFWYMPTEMATGYYSAGGDTNITPGFTSVTFTSPSIGVGLTWGTGR